jgi:hypothetical protein
MNTTASGGQQGKKTYSAKAQVEAESGTRCSFCWFVMITYPKLKEMTPRDEAAFQEHLRKAHGLRPEILP